MSSRKHVQIVLRASMPGCYCDCLPAAAAVPDLRQWSCCALQERLSAAAQKQPKSLAAPAYDSWDGLRLKYTAEEPINQVIPDTVLYCSPFMRPQCWIGCLQYISSYAAGYIMHRNDLMPLWASLVAYFLLRICVRSWLLPHALRPCCDCWHAAMQINDCAQLVSMQTE